jgi:enamine deaminase RidA (YjgF/YER057c/UK114 family)
MPGERICPPGVHTPFAAYNHVSRVGNVLYISGQLPVDVDGNLVGKDDAEKQSEQCIKNIQTICEHFGGSLANVEKTTTFITELAFRPLVARSRDRLFSAPYPASTLVVIKSLAAPEYLVEIEAIAVLE